MDTYYIEHLLKVLVFSGVPFLCYSFLMFILSTLVEWQEYKIKKRVNHIYPNTFKKRYTYINPVFVGASLLRQMGFNIPPYPWSRIKKIIFKDFDIESLEDDEVKSRINTIKKLFVFNKIGYNIWIFLTLAAFIFFLVELVRIIN